jgi:DMSO/TMAO reductase YedYZ molybdopterin-dependent catalytic subunit
MAAISRGFHGRLRDEAAAARLAPGQYLTQDFPVLSAGPTPHQPLDAWTFEIRGEVDEPSSWTWEQLGRARRGLELVLRRRGRVDVG